MTARDFWTPSEFDNYLDLLRHMEAACAARMELVRRRLEAGYYLTPEVARATAEKMLARARRRA